jgi:hypothetical protein
MFVSSISRFDDLVSMHANVELDKSRQIPRLSSKLIYKLGLLNTLLKICCDY